MFIEVTLVHRDDKPKIAINVNTIEAIIPHYKDPKLTVIYTLANQDEGFVVEDNYKIIMYKIANLSV